MKFLVENWYIIVAFAAMIALAVLYVNAFVKKPRSKQIEAVKQWLLYAVSEAEKVLGSGTGSLKLRYVYDKFVQKFPWVATFVSFDTFSIWVDEALERMKELLKSNTALQNYVEDMDPIRKEA